MLLIAARLALLVPARHLRGRQIAKVDTALARTSVALAFAPTIETAEVHLATASLGTRLNTTEEGGKVHHELLLFDSEIVVKKVEELLLHQVDLGLREKSSVLGPVLVLGRRVVEVLGGDNEGSEEDTVTGAMHALGDARKPRPQALQVDESAEQGGHLDVGALDEECDKGFQTGKAVDLELARRISFRRGNGSCWGGWWCVRRL